MDRDWIKENQRRQEYLDWLYEISDRNNREHPFHSLYVDLIKERKETLLRKDMQLQAGSRQEVAQ